MEIKHKHLHVLHTGLVKGKRKKCRKGSSSKKKTKGI